MSHCRIPSARLSRKETKPASHLRRGRADTVSFPFAKFLSQPPLFLFISSLGYEATLTSQRASRSFPAEERQGVEAGDDFELGGRGVHPWMYVSNIPMEMRDVRMRENDYLVTGPPGNPNARLTRLSFLSFGSFLSR